MKIGFFAFFLVVFLFPLSASGQDIYYQAGDFAVIEGRALIAAPNGVGVDVLNLSSDGKLTLISRLASRGNPFSAVFAQDNNNPVIIAVSGRYLEKFLISQPEHPVLELSLEIPGHYFYHGAPVPESKNLVLLSSTAGVELRLVNDFSLIDALTREPSLGASWSKYGFIPIVSQAQIILGNKSGELVTWHDIKGEVHIKVPRANESFGYFPTDSGIFRLSPSGEIKKYTPKTLKGHAVLLSPDGNSVYFANGWGVIKLDPNLKYIKSAPLSGNDFWAAGLSSAEFQGKKFIIVYNGNGLRVIDEKLKVYSTWTAPALNVNKDLKVLSELRNGTLRLNGSGFYPGEDIEVSVNGIVKTYVKPGNLGSFESVLNGVDPGLVEIKGLNSGMNYQSDLR